MRKSITVAIFLWSLLSQHAVAGEVYVIAQQVKDTWVQIELLATIKNLVNENQCKYYFVGAKNVFLTGWVEHFLECDKLTPSDQLELINRDPDGGITVFPLPNRTVITMTFPGKKIYELQLGKTIGPAIDVSEMQDRESTREAFLDLFPVETQEFLERFYFARKKDRSQRRSIPDVAYKYSRRGCQEMCEGIVLMPHLKDLEDQRLIYTSLALDHWR